MNHEELTGILFGKSTARDKQKAVGPSEIKGCARKVWHRLQETPTTNPNTLRLPSRMGTAIHKMIEDEFDYADPFSLKYQREVEVEFAGLKGHVDCYDIENQEVIDWKTITKKKVSSFPSEQQVTQVQIYGYLLNNTGRPVKTVTLWAICRDGTENDMKSYSELYDEGKALEGLEWLEGVKALTDPPEPELPARYFCKPYCQFYDVTGEVGCPGR